MVPCTEHSDQTWKTPGTMLGIMVLGTWYPLIPVVANNPEGSL